MSKTNLIRKALFGLLLLLPLVSNGQVAIEFEQNVGLVADGTTEASMQVTFTNDPNVGAGGISGIQLEMTVPSGISVAGCTNDSGVQSSTGHQLTNCDQVAGPGTFTLGYLDQDAVTGGSANQAIPDGTIFSVEFTAASGTTGNDLPVGFTELTDQNLNTMFDTNGDEIQIQPGTNFNGTPGSIDIACPTGDSCYSSSPIAVGGEFSFGEAVVGQTTSDIATTIENAIDSDSSFDLTGANTAAFVNAVTTPSVTLAPGESQQYDFSCTPQSRAEISSADTAAQDAIGVLNTSSTDGPEALYDATCTGLAPNVSVIPPSSTEVVVTLPNTGTNSSNATYEIFNDDTDALSSVATGVDVKNLQQTGGTGTAPTVSFSGVPTSVTETLTPQSSFDVTCEASTTTSEDLFTFTFDVAWNQPQADGTFVEQTISAQFQCNVTDTAPIFNSVPTEATGVDFGQVLFTTPETTVESSIDVFNDNPNGDDLNITSTPTVTGDGFQLVRSFDGPYPGTTGADGENDPNGGGDIVVSCTPPGVGILTGTLTVETNSADSPHTYDLACEGTGDVVTSSPADGGTLNLGSVPPGTQTNPGTISFTNNNIAGNGEATVDCTVTDNSPSGDVFTFSPTSKGQPDEFSFVLAEGATEEANFQCTPPDISSFTAEVSCDAFVPPSVGGDARGTGQQLNFEVTCSGRPLVIPTMSRWGLVVMSLMLLLVGGFATRRMMA